MNLIDKIKLLWKAKGPAQELLDEAKQAKTGWKTLGFWVSVLASLGALVAACDGVIPAVPALIAVTCITLVYNALRAYQNAQQDGVTPPLKSTRFWIGILGLIASALLSLKTGGIQAPWLLTANTAIAAIMAAAQSVGANQPDSHPPAPAA